MKIAMLGTGYVGLVTGTCLAENGNEVTCIDVDSSKIERLKQGQIPIYEPGLSELVARNASHGRLHFTNQTAQGVKGARLVFLAVGTPSAADGSADLTFLHKAAADVAPHIARDTVVVIKSTVPVGTNRAVYEQLQKLTGRACHVASNPEFLKEGAALDDFMKPDRVVVGVRDAEVGELLQDLYQPFLRTENPFLVMSPESAEMTKYVANALLATKISFINEIANLCERMEADINDVRRGIGHDRRLGFSFLFPGVGYGGSCFPKDVRALQAMARQHGVEPRILEAVDVVNTHQKSILLEKIMRYFDGALQGKTLALWGLAFKPRTDDVREAPSLVLIDRLLKQGAKLQVHDPVAIENVRREYGSRLTYAETPYEALKGAHALAILTEWDEFRHPDFAVMKERLKQPVIFDGRNLYSRQQMKQAGFTYFCIGRPSVRQDTT